MPDSLVPVFKLYGETRQWPTPDLLHCESIPERSQRHDWHIRAHRHADLHHLLHLSAGGVRLELEGGSRAFDAPLLIVVPAMSIHGFRFSPDTEGHIVTLSRPLVEGLQQRLGDQAGVLAHPEAHPLTAPRQRERIATLIAQIDDEYRHPAPGRRRLLEALMEALIVETARLAAPATSAQAPAPRQRDEARTHLQAYQTLIEAHYAEQPGIEWFAERLGITSAHLNLLCRRLAGRSALQLLHERLLLEAKRQLIYTNMTVGEVADGLGFSEPAYFTRFFKRLAGTPPRDFRQRQGEGHVEAPGQQS
ncbi:helix-turn-helix domain-containing protein [Halomonas getboli]|uniref:helix-turn-helix domain-containing protein n=1 Tax=Halomonas getboli TaxID=2935862 RepID=UPI001FFFCC5B|nr:helix-turn-helix domain-containing protein [Halomonas getboli]MCK2183927.1 helix-turn-helix domain-containing protein [Halomonas getboli]